ncbi:MAG TPA: hypothetical protein VGF16_16720 [Bryobacteraceae bacterium]|jgi:hypothetical protein
MSAALVPHPHIDTAHAELPAKYQAAKSAIAICERIDECQDWADKAAALASYAKQAKDDELVRMATRIQLRAVRRCGELLKAIAPGKPGPKEICTGSGIDLSRTQAAADAGLSKRQKDTALRVAAIPEEEFELTVESASPTVTEMAERGTRKAPIIDLLEHRDPKEFQAATYFQGSMSDLAQWLRSVDPAAVMRGSRPNELPRLMLEIAVIEGWLSQFKEAVNAFSERTAR